MTSSREWIPARLVRAALEVPERAHALGEAIWLYLYVLLEVGHQGRLCRQSEHIAADLGANEAEVETWLTRLVEAGLVEVLSPSPFLVIVLLFWPGRSASPAVNAPGSSSGSGDVPIDVPVSSSAAAAASSNHGEVGGRGEGEGLLGEVLAALDEADPDEFRQLLGQHPAEIVRRALRRVQTTPPAQIRKSKAALFRYLLGKFTATSHDHA